MRQEYKYVGTCFGFKEITFRWGNKMKIPYIFSDLEFVHRESHMRVTSSFLSRNPVLKVCFHGHSAGREAFFLPGHLYRGKTLSSMCGWAFELRDDVGRTKGAFLSVCDLSW